jgi:AraC family transcriptional regulator of arabinose operon
LISFLFYIVKAIVDRLALSLDHLADTVSLSRSRLIHLFQEVYHVAPYQYYLSQKCKLAQSMLSRTTLPVSAISTQLGFLDPHHFSSFFKKQCGLSPASYRKLHTAPGNFPT